MKFSITLDAGDPNDMAMLAKLGFAIRPGEIQPAAPIGAPAGAVAAQPFQPPAPAGQPAPAPAPAPVAAAPAPPPAQPGGGGQAQFADACQKYASTYGPKAVKARFAQMSQQLGVTWTKIADVPAERYAEAMAWFAPATL